MADPLDVQVVSAERVVWSGESTNIIARTTDGDIGILPGHEPVLAILVPSGVEIFTVDHHREIVAVDVAPCAEHCTRAGPGRGPSVQPTRPTSIEECSRSCSSPTVTTRADMSTSST